MKIIFEFDSDDPYQNEKFSIVKDSGKILEELRTMYNDMDNDIEHFKDYDKETTKHWQFKLIRICESLDICIHNQRR